MRIGYLAGAAIFFILSLACIGFTTVEVIRGNTPLFSYEFLAALIFHPGTALVGVFLLGRAVAGKIKEPAEEQK
jgi:hypothetical protein